MSCISCILEKQIILRTNLDNARSQSQMLLLNHLSLSLTYLSCGFVLRLEPIRLQGAKRSVSAPC